MQRNPKVKPKKHSLNDLPRNEFLANGPNDWPLLYGSVKIEEQQTTVTQINVNTKVILIVFIKDSVSVSVSVLDVDFLFAAASFYQAQRCVCLLCLLFV